MLKRCVVRDGRRQTGPARSFVVPRGLIVALALGVEAGVQAVLRELESFLDDERGVREVNEIIVRDPIVLNRVVDQAAEKRDVGAGADLQEQIGGGGGPREARI